MKYLFLIILFAYATPAFADTWYVRPAEGTYGTSSQGISYSDAFDGFADVAWGGSNVKAGDTLYVCGRFDLDSVDGGANPMMQIDASGLSNTNRITINGDCSAQGDLTQAILDGEETRPRGIDSGSAQDTYITIKNILIQDFTSDGVIAQGSSTTVGAWRFENVDVVGVTGSTSDGYDLRGTDYYIDASSSVTSIGEDGFYIEGDNLTIMASCTNPSLESLTGDCLQMNGEADNFLVDGFRCIHTTDAKQCVFVSTTNKTGYGTVQDSYCDGPSATADLHTCFFFEDLNGGTVKAYRNYGKESRYLFYTAGTSSTLVAHGNIGHGFSSMGIQCGTRAENCILMNNSISDAPVCFSTESALGTSTVVNNIGAHCTTSGIRKNAQDTETHNIIYKSGDVVQNETTQTTPNATTASTSPQFRGGEYPTSADGFRLEPTSPAIFRGRYTTEKGYRGRVIEYTRGAQDYGSREFAL